MTHSPEPWERGEEHESMISLYSADGKRVAEFKMSHGIVLRSVPTGDEGEANFRRVLACVNACAGIPTEELERRGQNYAGNVSVACATLDVVRRFYEGGGLGTIPRGVAVTPGIRFEMTGWQFLGQSLKPYERPWHIDEAKELLRAHGFVVTEPADPPPQAERPQWPC